MDREDNFYAGIIVSNHPRFVVRSEEPDSVALDGTHGAGGQPDSVALDGTHGAGGQLLRVREVGRLSKNAYYRPPMTIGAVLLDLIRSIFGRSK
mgnify:CR=1 FL=1